MKKWIAAIGMVLVSLIFAAGCGTSDEAGNEKETAAEQEQSEENAGSEEVNSAAVEPKEPSADDKCAFCNMKVYGQEHEMGAHTAQMVTEDGEHLYFDDIGCLLNHEHETDGEPAAAWVRDYNTKEWIPAEEAVPVKADIKTPMKYGVALFKNEEDAKAWAEQHEELQAMLTSMEAVNEEANERMQKKKEMMKQNGEDAHDMNQDSDEEMDHEQE
ncbi:nitrous oxide reductase accessory protein NosL [Bacillus marinisedimentorum]|uniref:nitrous oxide reductase accessory protein NosL n=1 Tax=Bacillus marinisedimentorum TaxID=1821260 RepID=UPI0008729326|nr:nitrous oxide reductase accessory protein NosL [Bacillus marinisedimentorum]